MKIKNSSFNNLTLPTLVEPATKHYAWGQTGSDAFIPVFLKKNTGSEPWAEAWVGSHKNGTAELFLDNRKVSLNALGLKLPWLLKLLSVQELLSVQVHPSRQRAKKIYMKEKSRDDIKTYVDANHKSELAIPITDFWVMAGFLTKDKFIERLSFYSSIYEIVKKELNILKFEHNLDCIAALKKDIFAILMNLSQKEINKALTPVIKQTKQNAIYKKNELNYWLLKADRIYTKNNNFDVGLFCFFLLNLIKLTPLGEAKQEIANDALICSPGEALFIKAGEPHFYLEGVILELMACSDNVVRIGFTPKEKNKEELLQIIDCTEKHPSIITPVINAFASRFSYRPKVDEFQVDYAIHPKNSQHTLSVSDKPTFIIIIQGRVNISNNYDFQNNFQKGDIIYMPSGNYCFKAETKLKYFEVSQCIELS